MPNSICLEDVSEIADDEKGFLTANTRLLKEKFSRVDGESFQRSDLITLSRTSTGFYYAFAVFYVGFETVQGSFKSHCGNARECNSFILADRLLLATKVYLWFSIGFLFRLSTISHRFPLYNELSASLSTATGSEERQ